MIKKLINIFAFLVHILISLFFIGLGYLLISWDSHYSQTREDYSFYKFIIIISIVLFITSFFILFSKDFKKYIIPFAITFFSMVVWIIVEGSMDVSFFLPIYLIIFTPVLIYMYKKNKIS